MKNKIAAVVVTYNRKELLIKCIDSLLEQSYKLDAIILIDNASTDNTEEFLKEKKYLDKKEIIYIKMDKNYGGAGGFHYGLKYAFEKNFDWIWLMDDDCLLANDSLEQIFNKKINPKNVYLPLCLDIEDKSTNLLGLKDAEIQNNDEIYIDFVPFNGFLISKELVEKIGYPEKDYFIYADDTEYCYRVKEAGGKIIVNTKSFIYHPNKIVKTWKKFGLNVTEYFYSKMRIYYCTRNHILMRKKHNDKLFISVIKMIIKSFKYLILGEYKLFKLNWRGIIDGIIGKTGKKDLD